MDKSTHAATIFNKHAKLYEEKFMDTSQYHESFDIFCKLINKDNADILELACGPGNISKYIIEKKPEIKLQGLDLAPNMIDIARINNPQGEFMVMDCRDILKLNKKFDAILCGFCFPYLSQSEVVKLINDSFKILNSGGVIYISTMEDDYIKSDYKKGSTGDEIFMHYYLGTQLESFLKDAGFDIRQMLRKYQVGNDGEWVTDVILIAVKEN